MDFNQFGDNLEDSANFLIEKLMQLHPWDDEWKYNIAVKLVPIYKEVIDEFKEYFVFNELEFTEENFDNIIKFSSILTKDQLKLLFMGDLSDIPLIYDGKYLSDDERIDLLIEYKNRLKKVDSNIYLFFNHVENYLD
ncbi:MAG: hypothetical protein IJI80_02480 [Methanobrevibacter sp.]|uniref:hypothetical protein n=1 Tax=Methanobrevibacter sp. TaxID=66852 RepID=UPI0025E1D852|nr:hypothetical protein [Methanobrevibacter sp.]MBQ6138526.1 hypothetical protein [Methanobrevibacter sp.]